MDERNSREKQLKTAASRSGRWDDGFRTLVESGHVTFVAIDAIGRITFFNKALSSSTGLSADEIIGRPFIDFVHPDNKERVLQLFYEEFITPKGYTQLEVRILGKLGVTRHMIASVGSVREQGKIVSFNALLTDITERKRAEEALKISEEKFRNLVENAPVGIGITTLDGTPVYRNKAMCDLYGYASKEELMQEHMVARYHDPKDRERFIVETQQGAVRDFEVKLKRKDGTDFRGSLTAISQVTEFGQGYFTIIQDVSERKKSEEELKLRAALLDIAKDAIVLRNFDEGPGARFLYVNGAACKLYGYTKDELMKMRMRDIAFVDDPGKMDDRVAARRKKLIEVGEDYHEWVHFKKDGTRIPVEHHSSISILNGKRYILSIIRDISQRKKTEEALKNSEEKFQSLFMTLCEGIALNEIIYDSSGRAVDYLITDVNPAFGLITGLKREDTIGMTGSEFYGKLTPPHMDIYSKVAESGVPTSFQARFTSMAKDFTISVSSHRKGIFATVFFDITSIKRTNEQVLAYQKELQLLANQLSLAEERSRRAIAVEVHDQLGQTLAICGMKLGELAASNSSAPFTEKISEVQTLLKGLVGQARSLAFELSSPLLYEVGLEAAIERLTEQIQENYGIQCSFKDDGRPKQVNNDARVLLFQAVRELLFNVTKHSRANHASVSMKNYRRQLWITVKDNGIGFDASSINIQKKISKGFGLLSVNERIRYVGGLVEIHSQVGQGTEVTLKVPLQKQ